MLRKSYLLAAVAALLVLPTLAHAQFQAGNWDLNITGNGASNKGLTNNAFSVGAQIGYLVSKELEVGVRQSFNYSQVRHEGQAYGGTTVGFVDYHFDMGAFQPFVGGNIGYTYALHVKGQGGAGPEAGIKYFLNSTTYVYGIIQYEISLSNDNNSDFVYGLGLGVALK